ncbi:hypothetical protein HDU97_005796 [Phlyctochytrium planicorne]|nr:hypothetical protein HDU97_005796 [Phlyctochytrium planicorne]
MMCYEVGPDFCKLETVVERMPSELQSGILKHLPPTCGKILTSALGIQADAESVEFAASAIRKLGLKGERLRTLNWLQLGKYYVAALLSSVPVGLGLLYVICDHLPSFYKATIGRDPLVSCLPCSAHKNLILDAIKLLMPKPLYGRPAQLKVWESCRHPLALPFFAVLGQRELLFDCLDSVAAKHPVTNSILPELMHHCFLARQIGIYDALGEHPSTKSIFDNVSGCERALALASSGKVERLSDMIHNGQVDPTSFVRDFRDMIKAMNTPEYDHLEDIAKSVRFVSDTFGKQDSWMFLRYDNLIYSVHMLDVAMDSGVAFLKTWTPRSVASELSPSSVRYLNSKAKHRKLLISCLQDTKSNFREIIKDGLILAAEEGRVELLEAWYEHAAVKTQPWLPTIQKRSVDIACLVKQIQLAATLLSKYKVVSDSATLLSFVSDIPPCKTTEVGPGNTVMHKWIRDDRLVEVLKGILDSPTVSPSAEKNLALKQFSKWGRADLVKMLLEDSRLCLPSKGREALVNLGDGKVYRTCSADARFDFSKLVLDRRLFLSIGKEALDDLLSAGKIWVPEQLQLLVACRFGDAAYIKKLISNPAKIDKSLSLGKELFRAVKSEQEEVVEILLNHNTTHPFLNIVNAATTLNSWMEKSAAHYTKINNSKCQDKHTFEPVGSVTWEQLKIRGRILAMFITKVPSLGNALGSDALNARMLAIAGRYEAFAALNSQQPEVEAYVEEIIDSGCVHISHINRIIDDSKNRKATLVDVLKIAARKGCVEVLEAISRRNDFSKIRISGDIVTVLLHGYRFEAIKPSSETLRGLRRVPTLKDYRDFGARLWKLRNMSIDREWGSLITLASQVGDRDMVQHLLEDPKFSEKTAMARVLLRVGRMNPFGQHEVLSVLLKKGSRFYPAVPDNLGDDDKMEEDINDLMEMFNGGMM